MNDFSTAGTLWPDPWSQPPETDLRFTDPEAARYVAAQAAHAARFVPRHLAGIEVARARARRRAPGPVDDEDLFVDDVTVRGAAGPLPARRYRPRTVARGSVLYLHGGGWATGDLDLDDVVCRRIAADAQVAVLSLGYRLAPEHPFPAALDDAAAAADLLADNGFEGFPTPLVVAGSGAGASLAVTLARRARDGVAPMISHQLLLCPVLDCDLDRPSYREFGDAPGLTREDMAWCWSMYVPDRAARRDPEVSPGRITDVSGICPTAVVVAGVDPLRDEGVEHAGRLSAAGVDVHVEVVDGVPHGFVAVPGLSAGRRALRSATDHLVRTLARTATGSSPQGWCTTFAA